MLEEGEGLAGLEGLHPEAHLAQLDGHGVHVHAVEAVADDVAQGRAGGLGGRLLVARADGGEAPGDPVGGGDQEVAAPAGRVADLEAEDRALGIGLPGRLLEHRVQGGVEEAPDQGRGRVVAAGGLPLVTAGRLQLEARRVGVDLGVELQERLVDTPQLLRAEVLVVHGPADALLDREGERADAVQEVVVRQPGGREVGDRLGRPEEAPEGREPERRVAGVAAEAFHDEPQAPVEVGVPGATRPLGEPAEAARRVEAGVALPGRGLRLGVEEQVPVLGDEEEEEPVDEPEELAVVLLGRERPGAEPVAERAVGRVGEEAAPESRDRRLDPVAQAIEGARPLLPGRPRPALEPALPGLLALDARLVGEEPEEDEVGVDLALHHGLEVELDEGLASEARVVAEEAQPEAVRDEPPHVLRAPGQKLLD